MKRLPGAFAVVFAVWAGFFAPPVLSADLEGQVASMLDEFQPAIESLSGTDPYLVAVGSFFDPASRAREPLSRDVEDLLFDQVMKRFAQNGRAVIVEWMRGSPLTPEKDAASSIARYRLIDAVRQMDQAPGRGFLITGYAHAAGGAPLLRAELIAIHDGTVAKRFGPPLTTAAGPASVPEAEPPGMKPASTPAPDAAFKKALPGPAAQAEVPAATAPEPAAGASAPKAGESTLDGTLVQAQNTAGLTATVIEGKNFRYEGHINAQGEKHGHGTLIFSSGDRYEGQWKHNRMHGEGTYAFADGDKYVGQWQDNKMHGRGTYFYASGDKYTGQFADDVKDGSGTYIFKNGDRWEGAYLQGKKHGKAVYIWPSGQTQEELWNMGQKME
ncbi:MAG: hypothetical protein K9L59_09140 [Desulfobacterales bacterium]|nr:hypothetical protein [Desulfobacterales bacterium]